MSLQAKYTILRKIADGGTAEIFLATQHGVHGFEKPVVLKKIFPAFYADPQFRNMLIDEAHIAMSLNQSGIVQVLDLGEDHGQYVLALELVDGWTLDNVLRRARAANLAMPPALALYITAEVCRALAYAHAKLGPDGKTLGIVHRDISPHNVLLSEQGEVKLTDFGIAKARNRREKSLGNMIKGKIAYMSPEQANGEELDARSDLFSVGTMLYVMICQRYPFDAPTDLELLLLVKAGDCLPPERARPGLNPELYRALKHAMAKRRDERYQRAEEMLVDVEQVMRIAFRAVGQTELKRWLAELSERDGVLPLTKTDAKGRPTAAAQVAVTPPSPVAPASTPAPTAADAKLAALAPSAGRAGGKPPPFPGAKGSGGGPGGTRGSSPSMPAVRGTKPTPSGLAAALMRGSSPSMPAARGSSPSMPAQGESSGEGRQERPSTPPTPVPVVRGARPTPQPGRPPPPAAAMFVQRKTPFPPPSSLQGDRAPSEPEPEELTATPMPLTPPPDVAEALLRHAEGEAPEDPASLHAAVAAGAPRRSRAAIDAAGDAARESSPAQAAASGDEGDAASGGRAAQNAISSGPVVVDGHPRPAPRRAIVRVGVALALLLAVGVSAKILFGSHARSGTTTETSSEATAETKPPLAQPAPPAPESGAGKDSPSAAVAQLPNAAAGDAGDLATTPSADTPAAPGEAAAGGTAGAESAPAVVATTAGETDPTPDEAAPPREAPPTTGDAPATGNAAAAGSTQGGDATDAGATADGATEEQKVLVTLKSSPSGANVETAHHSFGTTPATIRLRAGRNYMITFSQEGYQPVTKRISVGTDETQDILVTLHKAPPSKPEPTAAKPAAPPKPAPEKSWWKRVFKR